MSVEKHLSTVAATGAEIDALLQTVENAPWVAQVDFDDHSARHESGGADEINHDNLAGFVANEHATPKNSIEIDAGDLQLVGDAAAPGNEQYWGTNSAGAKGFFGLPSGGRLSINQTSHGFSVGEVIRVDSANGYAKAQANTAENADVVGWVDVVIDTNNFIIQLGGFIENGVPNEPAETVMFLSPTTAGALTTTEPTEGQIRKPVLIIKEPEVSAFFIPQSTGFLVPDPQAQFDEDVQALGNISGATAIDLTLGTAVTATLTGAVTLSFDAAGRPASGQVRNFSLKFTNVETITWPTGTLFVGDAAPTALGTLYEFPCQIDSAGVVTVLGVLDNIGDGT